MCCNIFSLISCNWLPWVPETLHARFPVSVKSYPAKAPRPTREKTSGKQGSNSPRRASKTSYFYPKWRKWRRVSAGRVLLLSLKLKKNNKEVRKSHLLSLSAFNFPLFTSFQELDLSAETLIKNITPREDEWLKVIKKGLHPKGQYTKVLINHRN